ncbi:MAG: serine hydrolase [Candidatus Eisenbacteria bacterium]|nr:serine hydrolase [Candidatus Eisenbacteria bacterium]
MQEIAKRLLRPAGLLAFFMFIGFLVAAGCGGATGESEGSAREIVSGETGEAVDEYASAVERYGFTGVLLVAREGEPLVRKGYGLADDDEGRPNTPITVFPICSLTKQFTAAAILRLEMEGILSTEDPLTEFFDDVPEDKGEITLHHLLTHTAGIAGSVGRDFEEIDRDEAVGRILEAPLLFDPGSRTSYSNAGYTLLAAVVELASGASYEEYMHDKLFEPAEMMHTGYSIPDWDEARLATLYDEETANGTLLDRSYPYWNLIGNGGMMSTLHDMFLWYEALKGEEVLDASAKEKLWTPFLDDYAYGWDVFESPKGTVVQHDGASMLGANAEFRWFMDEDVVVILLSNRSYRGVPMFEVVREEVEKLTFGDEISVPPRGIELEDEELDRAVGSYRLPSGGSLGVMREKDMLKLVTYDQDAVNALFQPDADPDTFDDLNAKAGRLIAAAVSGRTTSFIEELGDEATARRVQTLLVSELKSFAQRSGAPLTASISLGTVPVGDDGMAITGMKVRNTEGESHRMSFWWRGGRLVGIDQRGFDISIPMAPVSETEFVGYHLAFARVLPVEFVVGEDEAVSALRMGSRTASRAGGLLKGHEHDAGREGHDHGGDGSHDAGREGHDHGSHDAGHEDHGHDR